MMTMLKIILGMVMVKCNIIYFIGIYKDIMDMKINVL